MFLNVTECTSAYELAQRPHPLQDYSYCQVHQGNDRVNGNSPKFEKDTIERFLMSKRAENSSPCTIRAYRADLMGLSNFMGTEQGPELLSREVVRGFLALLHRKGASPTTARRGLAAIKSFIRWLRGEGIIRDDDFEKIKILPYGGDFPTAFPERDRLLLELMYDCGLRVS